jgi:2-polyprenyl-6-methoxyphenol hydroxylase-like FAD-dependent oxidoreductase
MNPMNGQGDNTSVEDAASSKILANVKDHAELEHRLSAFEELRLNRTAVIQFFSTAPTTMEYTAMDKTETYLSKIRGQFFPLG